MGGVYVDMFDGISIGQTEVLSLDLGPLCAPLL